MSEQEHPTSVGEPVGRQGARVEIQQRQAAMISGWLGVAVLFGLAAATYAAIQTQAGGWVLSLPIIAFCLVASTIVIVPPGQSRVVQFFGTYVGTVRRPGFWCVWPLTIRRAVSIRVRNFETNRLKVNDADGNPVEIAERVAIAGVEVVEVRISHLAYAPEIAQAMLRRQQANAVVAARSQIVEGAVGMVEMALSRLTEKGVVELDEERTASMVSNLMVVLCGDQPPTPVVNAGTLYQ